MTVNQRQGNRPDTACPGFVSLVGAGPGDPELLTWRAVQRLRSADLVLHDGLVPDAIVRLAANAEHVSVARRAGAKMMSQDDVSDRMVTEAWEGQRVVRLKAGDPFVFGRGGEEAAALARAGVPFEIVPGVTSAIAGPALAGIPVTQRDVASAFLVVTGHAEASYGPILGRLAPGSATVVVLMAGAERAGIRRVLERAGWSPETPAAIVTRASQPGQHVWTGTLGALEDGPATASPEDPGVIVIGDVVSCAVAPGAWSAGSDPDLPLPFVPKETSWQPLTIPRR
jgi:uroporphyrin-III C-methyltransferase/precorrin-2 dehydrogenase/sirohydrochlorin ferrochelatase